MPFTPPALRSLIACALIGALGLPATTARGASVDDLCAPDGSAPCNLRGLANGGLAPGGLPPKAAGATPDVPSVSQNPRMGVNFANYPDNNPGSYAAAKAAGASYDRVTISMAATAGGWGGYDSIVTAANAQSVQVLGTLVEPAASACDAGIPHGGTWCVPANLNLTWNTGNGWASWVYQVVNRYKASIHAWEIWNEPNLPGFWLGSDAQFALVVKRSYQAIKAADPTATVVFGGIYRGNNLDRTQGFWNALVADSEGPANNYFFDVMGYHLYDGGHCSTFDEMGYIKWLMPAALQSKPWWITESGIRVQDPAWDGFVTPYQQASWLITNYAYALFRDVKRYYFWRTTDGGNTIEPWGLMNDAGTLRPAYTAYQVAAQWLPTTYNWSVRHFDESSPNNTGIRITFYGTPLGRVSVFWNIGANPQTLTTFAVLNTGTYVYQDGSTAAAPASNGMRTFNLQAAPKFNIPWNPADCLVGSPPIILIERDRRPPQATLGGLPATSSTTVINLSWSATDTLGPGDEGVAGLWYYDGQFRVGSGAWQNLASVDRNTSTPFTGSPGVTYSFRVRAVDWAGNAQDWATANVVTTQISLSASAYRYYFPRIRR